MQIKLNNLEKELIFTFARSSGHGGQNINKVSTKVQVKWNIDNSELFNSLEKSKIKETLKNNLTKEGLVYLDSEAYREQLKNKEAVIKKLKDLIKIALKPKKFRKPTKPSFSDNEKRITEKKQLSTKKQSRRNPTFY